MRVLGALATGLAFAMAHAGTADVQNDFAVSFKAYHDAMARSHYVEAVAHAEKARKLGEEIYDDAKVIATLAYNHGHALAMMGVNRQAVRVLKETRKLMRQAYGPDSAELFRVEMALLNTVPEDEARGQLTRVMELASQHLAEDGEAMAELKLNGGMRVWWDRRAEGLLGEAAETFARLGETEREARAKFWIGKIHLGRDRYQEAVESMTTVVELLPDDSRTALMARANLVEAYERLGDSDRATEHCLAIGKTVPWTGTADYEPLFKEAPVVPRGAIIRNAAKVFVVLEFTVDEMGFVRDPVIVKSEPGTPAVGTRSEFVRSLHAAAINAAKEFRYAPRFVDGEPVAVEGVRNRIAFRRRD